MPCRFHNNDCELEEYWDFILDEGCPQKYEWWEDHAWKSGGPTKVTDKLVDTAWDVIIFQQSTPTGRGQNPYGGAADYDTYQPYLSMIMEYAVSSQKTRQSGNAPFLVWNMIRSYNSGFSMNADLDYTNMYNEIVSATASMQAETGIKLILKPATAMQLARAQYPETQYRLLLRDGWHASIGMGRFLEACTWFEQLFAPMYQTADPGLNIVGNTFRPTNMTTVADEVDDTKAAVLQQIAYDVAHPTP